MSNWKIFPRSVWKRISRLESTLLLFLNLRKFFSTKRMGSYLRYLRLAEVVPSCGTYLWLDSCRLIAVAEESLVCSLATEE